MRLLKFQLDAIAKEIRDQFHKQHKEAKEKQLAKIKKNCTRYVTREYNKVKSVPPDVMYAMFSYSSMRSLEIAIDNYAQNSINFEDLPSVPPVEVIKHKLSLASINVKDLKQLVDTITKELQDELNKIA